MNVRGIFGYESQHQQIEVRILDLLTKPSINLRNYINDGRAGDSDNNILAYTSKTLFAVDTRLRSHQRS